MTPTLASLTTTEPFNVIPFVFLLWGSLAVGFGIGYVIQRSRKWGAIAAVAWVAVLATMVAPYLLFGYLLPTGGAAIGGAIVAHCRARGPNPLPAGAEVDAPPQPASSVETKQPA